MTKVFDTGGQDAPETEETEEVANDESVEKGEPNPDGGGEGQADGEASQGVQEAGEGEEPSPEPQSPQPLTKEDLAEFVKSMKGEEKPPEPKQFTEEEWAQLEEQTGMSRKGLIAMKSMMGKMKKEMSSEYQREIASFKKDKAIEQLSKEPGFQDVHSLRDGMDEFLNELPPEKQTDKRVLQFAATYARGKKANERVTQANTSREVNRTIINRSKMSSPTPTKQSKTPQLTPLQKQYASKFRMSEEEYARLKNGKGKVFDKAG